MSVASVRTDAAARRLGAAVWTYLVVAAFALYFVNPVLVGLDPYFHARYAAMLPERTFDRTLPQAAWSVWNDRWADKEFLFHVAMMPFCQVESLLVPGAKLAGALFVVAFLASMTAAMRAQRIAGATWWVAALLCTSGVWWFRVGLMRGYLASLVLFPWIILFFQQRRPRALAVVVFVYTWSYTAPTFALCVVVAAAAGRWAIERLGGVAGDRAEGAPPDTRLVVAAALATLAGLVLHPHMPNHLLTFWIVLGRILASAWGLSTGGVELAVEFESKPLRFSLAADPGVFVLLAVAWIVAILGRRRPGPTAALMLWMTLPMLALYALSHRFIEYLAPMAVWAAGAVVSDRLAGRRWGEVIPSSALRRALLAAVAALALALHLWAARIALARLTSPFWNINVAGASAWLKEHAHPGELVVPLDWSMWPELFFRAPEFRYLAGMDPTLMEVLHPDELRLLEETRFEQRPFDVAALAAAFPGARFLVVWYPRGPGQPRLRAPGVASVYADESAEVFELPAADPPDPPLTPRSTTAGR